MHIKRSSGAHTALDDFLITSDSRLLSRLLGGNVVESGEVWLGGACCGKSRLGTARFGLTRQGRGLKFDPLQFNPNAKT
jgi:hypothetical protein